MSRRRQRPSMAQPIHDQRDFGVAQDRLQTLQAEYNHLAQQTQMAAPMKIPQLTQPQPNLTNRLQSKGSSTVAAENVMSPALLDQIFSNDPKRRAPTSRPQRPTARLGTARRRQHQPGSSVGGRQHNAVQPPPPEPSDQEKARQARLVAQREAANFEARVRQAAAEQCGAGQGIGGFFNPYMGPRLANNATKVLDDSGMDNLTGLEMALNGATHVVVNNVSKPIDSLMKKQAAFIAIPFARFYIESLCEDDPEHCFGGQQRDQSTPLGDLMARARYGLWNMTGLYRISSNNQTLQLKPVIDLLVNVHRYLEDLELPQQNQQTALNVLQAWEQLIEAMRPSSDSELAKVLKGDQAVAGDLTKLVKGGGSWIPEMIADLHALFNYIFRSQQSNDQANATRTQLRYQPVKKDEWPERQCNSAFGDYRRVGDYCVHKDLNADMATKDPHPCQGQPILTQYNATEKKCQAPFIHYGSVANNLLANLFTSSWNGSRQLQIPDRLQPTGRLGMYKAGERVHSTNQNLLTGTSEA